MLTRAGWTVAIAAIVLWAGAALLDYAALATLAAACVLALLVSVVWVLWWPRIEVEREILPDRVTAGDPAVSLTRVTNAGARPTPPLIGVDSLAGERIDVGIGRLGGRRSVSFNYRIPTRRRGIYDVGPIHITRSDPLGLAARTRPVSDTAQLWVHPRCHSIVPLPASLDRSLEGPTTDKAPRGSIAFHSLREYVLGDDMRHIHWRSSARVGNLMVRQHVDTSLPDVTVVLDTRRAAHTDPSFEEAVEVTASLVAALLQHRFPVRLITTSGTILSRPGATTTDLLDRLAEVQLEPDGTFRTVNEQLSRQHRGFAVIVITGSLDAADVATIGPLQQSFGSSAVVSLRPDAGPVGTIGRARVLEVETATEFATSWNQSGGR